MFQKILALTNVLLVLWKHFYKILTFFTSRSKAPNLPSFFYFWLVEDSTPVLILRDEMVAEMKSFIKMRRDDFYLFWLFDLSLFPYRSIGSFQEHFGSSNNFFAVITRWVNIFYEKNLISKAIYVYYLNYIFQITFFRKIKNE